MIALRVRESSSARVRKNDSGRNALSGELYVEIDLDNEIQKELSAQSRKFLYHYRKLFKELEARNQGNNALSRALETTPGKEKP